jgi:type IV fimbrial biogenesis protein FimT
MNPNARAANQPQIGFTLVELLITVSIVAILIAVALPDLRAFLVNNRLSSDVNGFVGLINYARSEAIARNQDVLICPKSNGATVITCESTQSWGEFETQVFVDIDGNGQRNANDILLKTIAATDPAGLDRRINRATAPGVIKFGAVGFSQTAHRFDIFAIGDAAFEIRFGRTICISRSGRVRVATANNACT